MDQVLFQNLCREYAEREIHNEKLPGGIGTLSEKTVHAVLKDYMDSNPSHQEQKFMGYIADIYDGSAVVEIQTRNLNKLRGKLERFLTEVPVTVVFPFPHTKYISWIDADTGEVTERRKSPKTGRYCDVMRELYKIKMFLGEDNLHLHIIFLDVEEYRLKNGYARDGKKGSTRVEQVPKQIADELLLDKPEDYKIFLPEGLPEHFTSKDLKKAAHVTISTAQLTLNILTYMGVVNRIGNKGRSILYERA